MKKFIKKTKQVVVVACALTLLASPVFVGKHNGPSTYRLNDVWFIGGF